MENFYNSFPAINAFWMALLLIGAVQGLFFAVLFYLNPRRSKYSRRYLSLLLLAFSLILLDYLAVMSGWILKMPHLIGLTTPLLFVIGPAYYLHVHALTSDRGLPLKHLALHLLPAFIILIIGLPFFVQSGSVKITELNAFLSVKYNSLQISNLILAGLNILHIWGYVYFSFKRVVRFEAHAKTVTANTGMIVVTWLGQISRYFCFFLGVYLIGLFFYIFFPANRLVVDLVFWLSIMIFIYGRRLQRICMARGFKRHCRSAIANPLPGRVG